MRVAVCFGANSEIVKQTLKSLLKREPLRLILYARKSVAADQFTSTINAEHKPSSAELREFDAASTPQQLAVLVNALIKEVPQIDILMFGQGLFSDSESDFSDMDAIDQLFKVNALSSILLCSQFVEYFKRQGRGQIIFLSSVAGERGKKRNGIYGVTKTTMTAYSSALRNYLYPYNVTVTTLLPGLTMSPMTAHLSPSKLMTSSENVGEICGRAILKQRDVAFAPWWWYWIMSIIKMIPEPLFKRLNL